MCSSDLPKEHRDRAGTGTGRLAHLCMPQSKLFVGFDFDQDERVVALLSDDLVMPFILFPGANAVDLASKTGPIEFIQRCENKVPLIFVLDASWSCAKTLINQNPSLAALPKVSFESNRVSKYGFKKQPSSECLSSIEAVHEIISLLSVQKCISIEPPGGHDILISVFKELCAFQSAFSPAKT